MSALYPNRLAATVGLTLAFGLSACGSATGGGDTTGTGQATTTSSGAIDITHAALTNQSADCADHVGTYVSEIRDTSTGRNYMGSLVVAASGSTCTFRTNSIPNHDLRGGRFATDVSAINTTYTVTRNPARAGSTTELSASYENALFLNGVKLDLLAAACYGVGNEPLGREKIGCNRSGTPWRYDPMHAGNNFGTDNNNAHTQPDGSYHYHGDPLALYAEGVESPVIGFAADGFPIRGPFISDNGNVRRVESGYTLRAGNRVSQPGEGAFPGGRYDGTYVDDWEWTNAGDLDACNGMVYEGAYSYFVTDSYPWVMGCFRGTPNASFRKGR